MSYAIMPFKIRLGALNEVLALRDEALFAWLRDRCRAELADLDDWSDTERPAREFLADLVLGRFPVERSVHLYGYCVKALCELWGAHLANEGWWGMRYGWFGTVSEAVARAGVKYDFTDLIIGGPGVDCPAPDDFPLMGHITRDRLQSHLDRLGGIDLAKLDDRQVVEAVEQVKSWLLECRRDDMDLVCFYH
nr:hypothetical protein GCM10020063_084820 [Dactylosporangium thailandense]